MRGFFLGLVALAALSSVVTTPAQAGSASPTGAWNSTWMPDDAYAKQVNLNGAIADELARKGGYGPGIYNSSSYQYIGEQTVNHNGDEVSSSSTAINNYSSTDTKTSVGDNSPGVVVSATTGTSQYSGTTNQGVGSQSTVGKTGPTVPTSSVINH